MADNFKRNYIVFHTKILLILCSFVILSSSVFGQSQYVTADENTTILGAGFQANSSNLPGFAMLSAGVGIRGELNIGLAVWFSNVGKIYAPYFNIIIKPANHKSNNPFRLSLFVQPEFYSTTQLSSKSTITIGAESYLDAPISSRTIIQPYILGALTNTPLSKAQFTKGAGLSFFHRGDKIIPVLKIGIANNENNTSGFINFSLVILNN